MKIQRSRLMSPTGKPVIVEPVWPNVGVQMWYQAQLDALLHEMYVSSRMVILPAARNTPVVISTALDGMTLKPTAAGVLFWYRGHILLLKRADRDGCTWGLPGGKIEAYESPDTAARRECEEEMQYRYGGLLAFRTLHRYRNTLFCTYEAEVYEPFIPTLNNEHTAYVWCSPARALTLDLHPGVRATLTGLESPEHAQDATPTKELQRAMQKWGDQWQKRFDLMSNKISLQFTLKSQQATQVSMMSQFQKAGFTVAFKPTKASLDAARVAVAENVLLIKSIAQQYSTDVQTKVWQSVKRGGDLKTLSNQLEKSYGVSRRRAARIARDQNMKAKATMEAVRHLELGIKQAIWLHSRGVKEPRPSHVKMNRHLYDLAKGMFDPDEGKYVHPGELINCGCSMRPFIPGFETVAYPEWEVAQT